MGEISIRFRRDSDDLEDVLARVLDEESDPEGMPSSEEIELHLELEKRSKNRVTHEGHGLEMQLK